MYLQHFGLKDWPFTLTPNMGLYYPTDQHQQVILAVKAALDKGEGFIKVTGEVGTGKTMLCRLLLEELQDNVKLAYITTPVTDADKLVRHICREFMLDAESADPVHTLHMALLGWNQIGKKAVLVIDEAQALGIGGLEAVRLLSNLETNTAKLLQIVLFGQPELDRLLEQHDARQIRQRISYSFTTTPLAAEDVAGYISHRLEQVANSRSAARSLFDRQAMQLLAEKSAGIPRIINILADKALLAAYAQQASSVKNAHATRAIADSTDILQTSTLTENLMVSAANQNRTPKKNNSRWFLIATAGLFFIALTTGITAYILKTLPL